MSEKEKESFVYVPWLHDAVAGFSSCFPEENIRWIEYEDQIDKNRRVLTIKSNIRVSTWETCLDNPLDFASVFSRVKPV